MRFQAWCGCQRGGEGLNVNTRNEMKHADDAARVTDQSQRDDSKGLCTSTGGGEENVGNIYLGGSLGFHCCDADNAVQFI